MGRVWGARALEPPAFSRMQWAHALSRLKAKAKAKAKATMLRRRPGTTQLEQNLELARFLAGCKQRLSSPVCGRLDAHKRSCLPCDDRSDRVVSLSNHGIAASNTLSTSYPPGVPSGAAHARFHHILHWRSMAARNRRGCKSEDLEHHYAARKPSCSHARVPAFNGQLGQLVQLVSVLDTSCATSSPATQCATQASETPPSAIAPP